MRGKSSHFRGLEPDDFGVPFSGYDFPSAEKNANSSDEVIGEIGLVLIVILGIVVVVNIVLVALHIS
jgi:hypothetical protein